MSKTKENKFYEALENIFTGAKVEGDGGYVNLLKIKERYYREILNEFRREVNSNPLIVGNFKEEFFDKLYNFFEKYFSESGSVYFVKTAHWQRIYEQVYTDNKDVVLFWKTHMLYYVKSDILFKNLDVNVKDEGSDIDYNFYFNVGELEQKQNNEKKELVFEFREIQEKKEAVDEIKGNQSKKTYVFDVKYSQNGKKTKIEEITKKTNIPEEIINKAIKAFEKQSEVDFFINKNARKFLEEQLEIHLHQILLHDENQFDQTRLDQIKTLKEYAGKIIDFISQFEDELVKVWNKPKFALNSNYVITLDKLTEEIIKKISSHKNLKNQIKEWQELGMVEENFKFNQREEKHKYLPIDTKYFKDLELDILNIFDDLDEALDGRIIHSENYQALNTLKNKYKEKVQCIYIDPPFNTGKDFAYVDKFQDSTWLTLMQDRIKLAREFLREDGSFYLHLDQNADYMGKILVSNVFSGVTNEIIWDKGFRGTESKDIFQHAHDIIFYIKKNKDKTVWNPPCQPYKDEKLSRYNKIDKNGNRYALVKREKTNGDIYYGEVYPGEYGKSANDVISHIPTMASTNIQRVQNFDTQKPEELLSLFVKTSSKKECLISDFFTGSATTLATAHKLNRQWLGVEMGEHFNTVALPRMKTVLFGKISGISKELEKEGELKKGGFFKYYSLEQYENTLRKMKYKKDTPNDVFDENNIFGQYIFFADDKFSKVLNVEEDAMKIDFDKLYSNIDLAETISNLLGLPIKKIKKSSVILKDTDIEKEEREVKINPQEMNKEEKMEFLRTIKPLLWWGE